MIRRANRHVIHYVLLSLGAVIMVIPFLWMLSSSLKTAGAIAQIPPQLLPRPAAWANYRTVWETVDFSRFTANSTLLVIVEMAGTLLSCSMVAFGLAMFDFKLKKPLYIMMLATLMLPFQVTLIPTYFIWKNLGALNTYYPLIVPSFLGSAFGIFLLHQFMKSLPKELYEAAVMDGYSPNGILWKIYVPLCRPALSALGIFTFIGAWNNTLGPLIYLQNRKLFTLPLGLLYLRSHADEINIAMLMAGSVIVTLPVVLVYLVAQKQFVQGIATTGLKG